MSTAELRDSISREMFECGFGELTDPVKRTLVERRCRDIVLFPESGNARRAAIGRRDALRRLHRRPLCVADRLCAARYQSNSRQGCPWPLGVRGLMYINQQSMLPMGTEHTCHGCGKVWRCEEDDCLLGVGANCPGCIKYFCTHSVDALNRAKRDPVWAAKLQRMTARQRAPLLQVVQPKTASSCEDSL